MTRRHDPNVAVAYLRVSTDDQRLGPQAQRASIEAWSTRGGIVVASWHFDEGVSGSLDLPQRPALLAALEDLTAHRAGVLVVAKRDRLARDVYVSKGIERAVAKRNALVVCADGVGNGEAPGDQLMRTILDGVSEYERSIIRARIKAAMGVKRRRGELVGTAPFGWRADGEGKRLVEEPREAAAVVRATELRAHGASLRAIVKALADEGHASRSGTPITLTQVARILDAGR